MFILDEVKCLYSLSPIWMLSGNDPTEPKRDFCIWQGNSSESKMSKRQKKKAPVVEEEPEVEIITRVEYTYEDTKCIVGVEPEYQWGEIYRLITHQ